MVHSDRLLVALAPRRAVGAADDCCDPDTLRPVLLPLVELHRAGKRKQ